ncbi:ABC transporter substrate-binding protein [Alkalihalobacillus trypoxylicola]|uniref:Myristoyl transferase n=1 Tax=Alkalihalobacillus trypoxylicola TaxID=519424 RepID=A0A161Q3U3_9BACI|nr:ABC transporter substrate-binding protein [Alkalihalobacillus trypoxylicola]KYG30758.1 myristoyl transferase [Alkalihalobacillus trypoxylicola]
MKMSKPWLIPLQAVFAGILLIGCGSEDTVEESIEANQTENEAEATAAEGNDELTEITQVTSWFPQVENAGQYYAALEGFYEEEGLSVTTEPGGPTVSSTQIVASGNAEIGMAQADQVLNAINEGIPLVVFFANFQRTPQGIMYHAEHTVNDFNDLAGDFEIYTAAGAGYWDYLVSTTDITDNQNRVYSGDNTTFASNPLAASQMYVTSEPFYLEQEGIETGYLLIAESGYSPYGDVLFTTKDYLEENPDVIQSYVDAITKGWELFQENPEPLYPYIIELEPEKTVEQMTYATEQMQELVFGGDATDGGVGTMTEERWQTLIDQLTDLELIDEGLQPSDVYTTEFLQ